jgi:hypothetical protein
MNTHDGLLIHYTCVLVLIVEMLYAWRLLLVSKLKLILSEVLMTTSLEVVHNWWLPTFLLSRIN